MSHDPFSPIDPAVPLEPPTALDPGFRRISCRVCTGGCLVASPPLDSTPDDPYARMPFEYAVAVQPDRKGARGHLAVEMECGDCHTLYELLIHADGRMELRDGWDPDDC